MNTRSLAAPVATGAGGLLLGVVLTQPTPVDQQRTAFSQAIAAQAQEGTGTRFKLYLERFDVSGAADRTVMVQGEVRVLTLADGTVVDADSLFATYAPSRIPPYTSVSLDADLFRLTVKRD